MKPLIFAGLAFALLSGHTGAEPLVLQPGTLLEELRTGVLTIHDNRLTTAHGKTVDLKLIKREKTEYSTKHYFEFVGADKVRFCEDGSPANYLGAIDYGSGFAVLLYKKGVDASDGHEFVSGCGDYDYVR